METIKRIVVTGPESTGKTRIAEYLSGRFNATWIPEYARFYIRDLQRTYNFSDIEQIARKQVEDYHRYSKGTGKLVIFDTWLIITKVWFEVSYGRVPFWLEDSIRELPIDLYLLCAPDLPWVPDGVRENEDKREMLFHAYQKEIEYTGVPWALISGVGEARMDIAEKALREHITF